MAGRFETWGKQWRVGWLGPNGQAYIGALGAALADRMHDWAVYALRQGLPEYAEEKNARRICARAGIEIGPALTAAEIGELGANAALLNRYRGTPLGMLYQLQLAGFPDAVIVQQNGRGFYLSGTPSLDDLRAARDAKESPSAFAVEVLGPNPAIGGNQPLAAGVHAWWTFDAGLDSAGNQWNSRFALIFPAGNAVDLTVAADLARLRRVIREWKPAKSTCVEIIDVTSGNVWGWPPGMAWGDPGLVWGGATLVYSP